MAGLETVDWSALARSPAGIALTVAVALAYPLLGYWRFRQIERLPEPLQTPVKLRLYLNVVLSQWLLVFAAAWVLGRAGASLGALGQRIGHPLATPVITVALLAGFALLSMATLRQLGQAQAADLPDHVRRAGKILPLRPVEGAGFAAVAVTAGVCEEILYRGWLPWVLSGWFGSPLLGFVVAAVVFGLGHAYQGRNGMILTALLGLFLGAVVYFTHSLIPAQLLHVAIDLVNGLAVGAVLARAPAPEPALAPPPEPAPGLLAEPAPPDGEPAGGLVDAPPERPA